MPKTPLDEVNFDPKTLWDEIPEVSDEELREKIAKFREERERWLDREEEKEK